MRRDYSDQTLKYEVRRLNDLLHKVIPFFDKYPLISGRKKDFKIFKQICLLMIRNKHLELNGFKRIVSLAFQMNESGRRHYTKKDIMDIAQKKI